MILNQGRVLSEEDVSRIESTLSSFEDERLVNALATIHDRDKTIAELSGVYAEQYVAELQRRAQINRKSGNIAGVCGIVLFVFTVVYVIVTGKMI